MAHPRLSSTPVLNWLIRAFSRPFRRYTEAAFTRKVTSLAPPIKVVLADDLPQIRSLLRRVLEKDGRFEIVGEASDGEAAVQMAWSLRPDALVLDLAMPDMNGIEAIPQILETAPKTKIIVLSGFVEMAADVLKAGAHGFFEKTAPPQELAATIADLVARDN